jgi:hypothetical protein
LFYPVKNQTGSSIAKGTAVRFAGTVGASGRLLIAPFIADGSVSSSFFMGVTAEAIADGEDGKVLYFGRIRGINTDAFNEGDVLYASTTVAGGFQTAVPVAPNNIVQVAAVINKSINQGVIFIRPSFGSNINQDEGVKIVSPTTGQLLQLQANGLWENKTTAQVLGGTSSQFVKGDGTLDSNTYQVTSEKGEPNGYASLDSNGKVPLVQINDALIGNVNFQGLWNASTNTPTLANPPASGTKGYYYIVSTAGTFAGISFEVGDWIISDGTSWGKVDNTDAVSSVFGRTGNVTAANGDYTTAQVTESGNLYYTDGRARGALSFVAGSGAYNSSTGVITIPTNNNQITNGAGYITSAALGAYLPLTGGTLTGALGGTSISLSGDITANRYRGVNSLVLNSYTTVNPSSNVYLYSPGNDRDAWIYLDSATIDSNWGIYHRQIDSAVSGLPANSIGFIGGGSNTLQAWISLENGNGFFAGNLTTNSFIKSGGTSGQFLKADGSVDSTTYVPVGRTITINGTTQDLSANRTFNVGTVTSVTASSPLFSSGGATPNITIQQASGSQNGFLSSTDWTTFNNKQNALTNPVTGTGTTNYLPKFTGTTTIGNSNLINDSSGNLGLAVSPSAWSSGKKAYQTLTSSFVGDSGRLEIWFNGYFDGDGEKYIGNGFSTLYTQLSGNHIWSTASNNTSGAGAALSYTQPMTLTSAGNLLIGTGTDNGSRLRVNGSVALPHVTKAENYTLNGTDYTVGFDCASNRTATLPDATTCAGRIYVIYQYNTNIGLRYVTIDGNGSQTINGQTTINLQYQDEFSSVMIQSNGSNWVIIASALYAAPV